MSVYLRMKNNLVVLVGLLFCTLTYSQEWNYARVSLLYGGNIPFNFNSIEKYRSGIEITDGTILGISLADSSSMGHILEGFDLNIRTFNGATYLRGEGSNLSLDKIRVRADNYLGLADGTTTGYQDLSAVWTNVFTYTNTAFGNLTWDSHQISLSYECGKPIAEGGNGTLLGEDPDYYQVEIEIEIIPTGPGF